MGTEDLFDTAALRRAVLDAWAASPARFREDANAEEELAFGAYRDRVVVELAQNAADAAARAGIPGRLRLALRDGTLTAANTGDPLTAEGVGALSTLRASAKRDDGPDAVGRFGVGFAAVLAVTDAPAVHSRTGAVRWSRGEARDLAAELPSLADELARRDDGGVPVLRLPFADDRDELPGGYDTVVALPLRDADAELLARRLLADIDDALLLTLPWLSEVTVVTDDGERVLTRSTDGDTVTIGDRDPSGDQTVTRWRIATAAGALDPALLADRPTEERRRPAWSVLWAVPVDDDGAPAEPRTQRVVHAPTPTDEPLGLPALFVASLPLDSARRRTAPGALREFVVDRAADTYAALLRDWPEPGLPVLRLVPGPAAVGEVDAELRRAVVERLVTTPLLPHAVPDPDPDAVLLKPRDAVVVEGARPALVAALAPVLPGLLPSGYDRSPGLRALGVRRLPLAEVVDLLASLDREPAWWHGLYEAFDPAERDALGALPVPLADGRTVRGPRHLLLPDASTPDFEEVLEPLGLRVVHPEAAHPLLERLGAVPATPRAVLEDPAVRAAVADTHEHDDEDVVDAVLELVRAAHLDPGELPWLAELMLHDSDGEPAPAGDLLLPGGELAALVDSDALDEADPALVERWGAETLEAVGVLGTFATVTEDDVLLDHDDCDHDLDAEDEWLDDVLDALPGGLPEVPPVLAAFAAVRDLDLVADDAWPDALRLIASRPRLRSAVTEPARVLLPDGGTAQAMPYTAWWLRGHPVLDGRTPAGLLAVDADPLLRGLYDVATDDAAGGLDPVFLSALGVRTTLAALLGEPGGAAELLDRLADHERPVGRDQLRALYTALAAVDPDRAGALPHDVRGVAAGELVVAEAGAAAVGDAPDLAALLADDPAWTLLPVRPDRAAALAELLEVPLVSDVVPGGVLSEGEAHDVPEAVLAALPGAPGTYVEHEELLVEGPDGTELHAEWRCADGVVHATTFEGLARGLAWAAGEWHRRFEVAQLLADPSLAHLLDGERDFDTV